MVAALVTLAPSLIQAAPKTITLDPQALRAPLFDLTIDGKTWLAQTTDWDRDGRTIRFKAGSLMQPADELESVVTFDDDGHALGTIHAGGSTWMITTAGSSWQVQPMTSSVSDEMNPVWTGGNSTEAMMKAMAVTASSVRRRAVNDPLRRTDVRILALYMDGYVDALGEDGTRLRINHAVDTLNTAFRNSGIPEAHFVLVGAEHVHPPSSVIDTDLLGWSTFDAGVAALRARYDADVVVTFSARSRAIEAWRPLWGQVVPNAAFAVIGGFVAENDDTDILNLVHEMGHVFFGDHNPENATVPASLDTAPDSRDWYRCDQGVMGALSYNVCGTALRRLPLYSNPAVQYNGRATGVEGQTNNARIFRLALPIVASYHTMLH